MIRNYFTSAWRSITHQKLYAAVKIGGFALGIAVCLLITLYIREELSYDRDYKNGDRIFRLIGLINDNGTIEQDVAFPAPFGKAIKEDYPEVERVGRINPVVLFGAGSNQVRRPDNLQSTYEEGFVYADQEILDIFEIPFMYGDRTRALAEPNTMVISKRIADKYFPNEDPIGKMLILNNDIDKTYRIEGVISPSFNKSHLAYDFFISLKDVVFFEGEQQNWQSSNYPTYIEVQPGTNIAQLEKKLMGVVTKYMVPIWERNGNVDVKALLGKISLRLQPVKDIYLKSDGIQDRLSHGDIRFLWILGIIATFIMVIASINFINLSTAKSINRAKEVGLRKAIGSNRGNLMGQFITESCFYSVISFVVGAILAMALLPFFNELSGKSLIISWTSYGKLIPIITLASVFIGMLAGLYPSFYLSSFKPAIVLKGNARTGNKSSGLRSALVVFQFTVSIILIIGTFIIYRQVEHILNTKTGFDKEQVLLLHGANTMGNQVNSFKGELLKLPEVKNASVSDYLPISGTKRNGNAFQVEGAPSGEASVSGQRWVVDHNYIKTLGMKIIEGRDFSLSMPTDSQAVIVNQTMVKALGLQTPVGKKIDNNGASLTIIGVVEDFNFESMREKIEGVCLVLGNSPNIITVKINTSDIAGALQSITRLWSRFSPNQSIRYNFLDESFAMMYADVKQTGRILGTFALLAIFVACLGLFALSSFMIENRTKEIGVRKVNGARTTEVMTMLNRDFVKWVAIAFVIACPIAWYAMHQWLGNFAYKTALSWWVFAAAGLIALAIAVFTVSFQSWRAATRNPVESLRYE